MKLRKPSIVLFLIIVFIFVSCKRNNDPQVLAIMSYSVKVNYNLSTEEAITHGKYDYVNSNITDINFPQKKAGKVETEILLLYFNQWAYSEEVIKVMDKKSLRSAELSELLALGTQYPDVSKNFLIIALGSVLRYSKDDRGGVPGLSNNNSKRRLNLYEFESDWRDGCCFAALSK